VLETWLFRIRSYARFLLHSGNTLGFGVHSPRLFYLANTIIPEQARYYCFEAIENQRARLRNGNADAREPERAELPRREAQLLFRLAIWLHARTIVEIGLSMGLTTAYLAMADSRAQVYTCCGDAPTLRSARRVWKELGIKNIHVVEEGRAFPLTTQDGAEKPLVDLAFLSASTSPEAVLQAFDSLSAYAGEESVLVIDDIRHDKQRYQVWKTISLRGGVTTTFDLGRMGLVFFDRHLPKQRFGIRM